MLLLSPAGMLLLTPAGLLGADSGGMRGLRVRVLPMSCRWGTEAYAAKLLRFPGQAVPPKGSKRDGEVSS